MKQESTIIISQKSSDPLNKEQIIFYAATPNPDDLPHHATIHDTWMMHDCMSLNNVPV